MTEIEGQCAAALNIAGEHYQCDYGQDHAGLVHGNFSAEAIWLGANDFNKELEETND